MEIVFSEQNDLPFIAELEKEWTNNPSSVNALSIFLNEGGISLSAKENGVVGYINATYFDDEAEIINIAVKNSYRGKGIGNELLTRFFTVCENKKIKKITLEVRESNEKAISLYKKCGFVLLGKRNGFYSHPREDALIFGRYIKD